MSAAGAPEPAPQPQQLFVELDPDNEDGVTEIESLCLHCHEQGMTRLMMTKIPFFKEVIISSFSCEHCGYEDREVQFGGRIQEKGKKISVTIKDQKDMDRQVVKSDTATFSIPEIEFEQPPSKKGEITTVEGILDTAKTSLEAMQPVRRITDPETAAKIDEFIAKLTSLKNLEKPFVIVVDDPAGNSFVENPFAPDKDEATTSQQYGRTRQQDIALGLVAEDAEDSAIGDSMMSDEEKDHQEAAPVNKDEILTFRVNCPECNVPCDTNMKLVDIPFFKEVVIMATVCDVCGFRENEVKGGSGIEPKGVRYTLRLTDVTDLSRDLLKSDTSRVSIPEIDLDMEEGTLGGKFTTLEGLLTNISDQLSSRNPFFVGDSTERSKKTKLHDFCEKLDKIKSGKMLGVHFVLDDPAGNSYLQNLYAPDEDPEMKVEKYERTFEQNETLGLNDMKTEGYEES